MNCTAGVPANTCRPHSSPGALAGLCPVPSDRLPRLLKQQRLKGPHIGVSAWEGQGDVIRQICIPLLALLVPQLPAQNLCFQPAYQGGCQKWLQAHHVKLKCSPVGDSGCFADTKTRHKELDTRSQQPCSMQQQLAPAKIWVARCC